MMCLLFTQRLVTCSDWDHRGNVASIVFLDDEKSLTLAFVNVSADLFVGLVTSARRAYAREASQSVAALTAGTVLEQRVLRHAYATFIAMAKNLIT